MAALLASASVRAVLDSVDGFRDVGGVVLAAETHGVPRESAQRAVEALLDAGALIDQSVVKPATVDDACWSAMWLLAGPRGSADVLLASRQRTIVHIEGAGRVAEQLTRSLVEAEQVPVTDDSTAATLVLVVADQEPHREAADEAMRRGLPFLCVGVRELVGLVGPFVVPGRTACLRCVDLGRAALDRCWTTLVDSAQASPPHAPSCPPSLASVTAGYAAQELALWASGAMPVCCDRVVEIPHGLGEVQTVSFQPHPHCGCGWRTGRETMSA